MSAKALSFNATATVAVRDAFTHPSYWFPALLLLAPTFLLQLVAPTSLRTRLAPAPWTVAAGAVLLVWLAQVALPAVCALVHARRAGMRRTLGLPLVRMSLVIGTRVTLGLAAALLPGLWLQAHYAFAPLLVSAARSESVSKELCTSTYETRGAQGRLLLVACVALIVSALGQSAVAALAEAIGTITAAGHVNGPMVYQLNFVPHTLTTVAAYLCSAAALTFHALCVSVLFDDARGIAPPAPAPRGGRDASIWVRATQITAGAAALGALVAAAYKFQQHLY